MTFCVLKWIPPAGLGVTIARDGGLDGLFSADAERHGPLLLAPLA